MQLVKYQTLIATSSFIWCLLKIVIHLYSVELVSENKNLDLEDITWAKLKNFIIVKTFFLQNLGRHKRQKINTFKFINMY